MIDCVHVSGKTHLDIFTFVDWAESKGLQIGGGIDGDGNFDFGVTKITPLTLADMAAIYEKFR